MNRLYHTFSTTDVGYEFNNSGEQCSSWNDIQRNINDSVNRALKEPLVLIPPFAS